MNVIVVRMALLLVQASQATVIGSVSDADTGEPLTGAVVTLTEFDRTAITDAQGRYVLRNVPAGLQHITVQRIGYTSRTLHALVPRAGELQIDVRLKPAPVRLAVVKVQIPPVVRGLEPVDSTVYPDRALSAAAIRNYALLSEPDAFAALSGGEVVVAPESPSGVHVRGGSTDQTAYVLDGVPIFSPYHAAGMFSAWNVDALSRVQLVSTMPSAGAPETLSGVIEGVTRTPGAGWRGLGSLSSTQARAAADGPVGVAGAGYLFSIRSGYPGIAQQREASYLKAGTGDLLGKIEAPVLGGRARLLAYATENEISAHAIAPPGDANVSGQRNVFEWQSRSYGAGWERAFGKISMRLQTWRALTDADASWTTGDLRAIVSAAREDDGLSVVFGRTDSASTTTIGARLESSRTSYSADTQSDSTTAFRLFARTPVATVVAQHTRVLTRRTNVELALSTVSAFNKVRFAPAVRARWTPAQRITLTGSIARTHQFAQSLRNPESVARNVFPVDLYVVASDDSGVPVARSDLAVLAGEYRPAPGARLGLQGYSREMSGLVLVAPEQGSPFSTGLFATGSGTARGIALDASLSGARYGATATYAWQRVRLNHGPLSYAPEHAAVHQLETGLLYFPSPTTSIRVGAAGAFHRRTTAIRGPFEWEACNLLDQGCEFSGTPESDTGALGRTRVPGYLRLDLGGRKHWHVGAAGRDATIALFGSITNVLGRRNLLTYAIDPETGARSGIEMLSRAPLVLGIDWRF